MERNASKETFEGRNDNFRTWDGCFSTSSGFADRNSDTHGRWQMQLMRLLQQDLPLLFATRKPGNIGGGGFMVIRMGDGSADVIDFREKAPAAPSQICIWLKTRCCGTIKH